MLHLIRSSSCALVFHGLECVSTKLWDVRFKNGVVFCKLVVSLNTGETVNVPSEGWLGRAKSYPTCCEIILVEINSNVNTVVKTKHLEGRLEFLFWQDAVSANGGPARELRFRRLQNTHLAFCVRALHSIQGQRTKKLVDPLEQNFARQTRGTCHGGAEGKTLESTHLVTHATFDTRYDRGNALRKCHSSDQLARAWTLKVGKRGWSAHLFFDSGLPILQIFYTDRTSIKKYCCLRHRNCPSYGKTGKNCTSGVFFAFSFASNFATRNINISFSKCVRLKAQDLLFRLSTWFTFQKCVPFELEAHAYDPPHRALTGPSGG